MSYVPRVFCYTTRDGRLCASILLPASEISPLVIQAIHRDVFCTIPEAEQKDCTWLEIENSIWKFSVTINCSDPRDKFRKEVYLWKALVRISPKSTTDIGMFTVQ